MRKWFRCVLAIVVVAVIGGVVWLALRKPPDDPVYKGKRLSVWLEVSGPDKSSPMIYTDEMRQEADEAIHHIGTNAIPLLLNMLRAKDSDLTLKLIGLAQKQHLLNFDYVTASVRNAEATWAFQILGSSASNAVPELIKIYDPNSSTVSQSGLIYSLGCIGPAAKSAVPLLLRVLATNTNSVVWRDCVGSLGEIHSEPEMVVPVLTGLLHDPKADTRYFATQALGHFGMNARPAISSLLELLEDQNSNVRETAFRALGQIYDNGDTYTRWWWNRALPKPFTSSTLTGVINYFGTMGTNAEPAVPALVKFLNDEDEGVRVSATNALKAINPAAAAKAGVR